MAVFKQITNSIPEFVTQRQHPRNTAIYLVAPKSASSALFHNLVTDPSLSQPLPSPICLSGASLAAISSNSNPLNDDIPPPPGPPPPMAQTSPHTSPNSPPSHIVEIHLINIRSIKSALKCAALASRVAFKKDYILGVTETWLQPHSSISHLLKVFPNSHLTRSDRSPQKGGGVLLLTSHNLPIKTIDAFTNGSCELLITELGTINTSVVVIYNPSGANFNEIRFAEVMSRLQTYVDTIKLSDPNRHMLLMGDFNFNSRVVQWVSTPDQPGSMPIFSDNSTTHHRALASLLSVTDGCGLTQLVTGTTHDKGAILDLLFTSCPTDHEPCTIIPFDPNHTDHELIMTTLRTSLNMQKHGIQNKLVKPSIHSLNFNRANKQVLTQALLDEDWEALFAAEPVVANHAAVFSHRLLGIATACQVPRHHQTHHHHNRQPHDEYTLLKATLLKRTEALSHQGIRPSKVAALRTEITELNDEIIASLTRIKSQEEQFVLAHLDDNLPLFVKYALTRSIHKELIGPLKDADSYTNDPTLMSDLFMQHFQSVFSPPMADPESIAFPVRSCTPLLDIEISAQRFEFSLNQLNPHSAPGPDCIMADFLKEYSTPLSKPLSIIWRNSLDHSQMPFPEVLALVTPLHKADDRASVNNYRPISLTNHITKSFERLLHTDIYDHLHTHNFLPSSQHGFRKHHSTITQLLWFLDSVIDDVEKGKDVEVLYLDFTKAFDKVDHGVLLVKLYRLGIQGKVLNWIKAFLSNRKQQVCIKGCVSAKYDVLSGVPQGSVLGPLLFLIMIIDLPERVDPLSMGLFADDGKFWKAYDPDNSLEPQLTACYDWSRENNLPLHDNKLKHIVFSQSATPNSHSYYTPSGKLIKQVTEIKDLGIIFQSDLSFSSHITAILSSANSLMWQLLRTFSTRDLRPLKKCIQTLIKPKIQYGSVIWLPHGLDLGHLEGVLKTFTSHIKELKVIDPATGRPPTYWQRLKILKLPSMERCYERYAILHMFKVIIGLAPNPGMPPNKAGRFYNPSLRTGIRVNEKTGRITPTPTTRIRSHLFTVRGVKLWNALPIPLRLFEIPKPPNKQHAANFKAKLDKYLENIPDQPGSVFEKTREATTNSLLDQIPLYVRNSRLNPPPPPQNTYTSTTPVRPQGRPTLPSSQIAGPSHAP